jgi:peptide/nickel transport system substrate-binding protein
MWSHTLKWLAAVFLIISCGEPGSRNETPPSGGTVIIALSSDPDALNPLIGVSSNTGLVLQFLFPELAGHDFDTTRGLDRLTPSLASSWEWKNEGRSLVYHLRAGALWSDGHPITSRDIKFSYELIANPKTASPRRHYLNALIRNASGQLDFDRAIETPDDSTIQFNFSAAYQPEQQLLHTQINFVPEHVFRTVKPDEIQTSKYNIQPVTGKHFKLSKWERKQEIVLEKNPMWDIPHAGYIDRIVFRIIPDMNTRIVELKTGAVDMVEGLSPEDAANIQKNNSHIRIESQSFRRFEYAGWSHIDVEAFKKSGRKNLRPHFIFGSRKVRTALTLAIRRDELIESQLGKFGQASTGPISPAFKWAYNDSVITLNYDPGTALSMLAGEGWKDHDGDGVLDKDGKKLEFTMTTNSGNPRREFALQKIVSDLKKIGILVRPQLVENNVFNAGLKNKEYEAFITGHNVNLSIDLQPQYGSDLEKNIFNAASYQNRLVDSLISLAASKSSALDAGVIFKMLHRIIYEDQPVTYLYWYDNIVGINQRIKGTHVNILSPYDRYYDWYISEPNK